MFLTDPFLQQSFIDKGGYQQMLELMRQGTRLSDNGLPPVRLWVIF